VRSSDFVEEVANLLESIDPPFTGCAGAPPAKRGPWVQTGQGKVLDGTFSRTPLARGFSLAVLGVRGVEKTKKHAWPSGRHAGAREPVA
jgi:hypothetical protein